MSKRIISALLSLVLIVGLFPLPAYASSEQKLLEGKTISIIGDSISTYQGWSDSQPITSEESIYRYGEAYYGETDSDCHNTDLLVTDTWWHQSATELGAEILMVNSGNSTGLFYASYSNNADWQQYLQDMLTYKSRPYYLGKDGKTPDIIALYIGSNEVGKVKPSEFGTVDEIDFNELIKDNGDGTYTYAEPATVAEAYCITLHKIQITYPKAEIYCFTVVPNAGGKLSTINKRLEAIYPFNEMVRDVAEYFNATVVENFDGFNLDSDGDGVATQDDVDTFQSYFYNDPHPNANGFDIITNSFVNAVMDNSKYIVQVETTAGNYEYVPVSSVTDTTDNSAKEIRKAEEYVTESNMIVNYKSETIIDSSFSEKYNSKNQDEKYIAEGGSEIKSVVNAPVLEVNIPLTAIDDESTSETDETQAKAVGKETGTASITGDKRESADDGIYDYTEEKIIEQASVTIDTISSEIKENVSVNNHSEMTYIKSDTTATESNNMITNAPSVSIPETSADVPAITDGYEFVYLGSDKLSNFWAAYLFKSPSDDFDINEIAYYSDDEISLFVRNNINVFKKRNLVVPALYLEHTTVSENGPFPSWYDSIQQFTLSDKNANIVTTYCVDQKTSAEKGYSYKITNIEDATYYTNNEAAMIRTIANNGYWGTKEGFGSLQAVKDMMKASGQFSESEVAAITDGMAMTATQYAIWTFSNIMDEKVFTSAYYTYRNSKGNYTINDKNYPADEESVALIFKLYYYLVNLEPTETEENKDTQSVVINDKNFLKNASIRIIGKAEENSNNQDTDRDNDVYVTDISFTLAVNPSTENGDNLVMKLLDGDNNIIAKGRVAGDLQAGEQLLIPDQYGKYTFLNISITEESVQKIKFELEGVQNLDKMPYLFTSEIKDGETSQTMVGIAEGHRNVGVVMTLEFVIDVSDEVRSVERYWRTEKIVETVPSVSAPDTGDNTNIAMWFTLMTIPAIGLAGLEMHGKKVRK